VTQHNLLRLGLSVAVSLALPVIARADDFPSRPITMVVGLSAGGITDITARLYAETVSKNVDQRILIDNRPTGGGAVAAANVQNAAPDGYTLLVFSGSQHAAVPALQPAPYEPIKGFAPITLLFDLAALVTVSADSPAKTLGELLAWGKQKPGGLLFGSPGVGTPSHLLAAKIGYVTKTPMQFVHYRGGAPMMADLVTGRVDFALASYTVAQGYFQEHKLKALAVDADRRLNVLPDVPTMSEAGLGDVRIASWFALAAPAETPEPIVDKLNAEFVKASHDPALRERLEANGTPIVTTTPERMEKLMVEEVASINELVRTLGLKQQ
jgi:tripartite-type tricarboxylate transporter receptor subunit TctC